MKYAISALHCFTEPLLPERKSLSDIQVIAGRYLGRDKFLENIDCEQYPICTLDIPNAYCSKTPSDEQVSKNYYDKCCIMQGPFLYMEGTLQLPQSLYTQSVFAILSAKFSLLEDQV